MRPILFLDVDGTLLPHSPVPVTDWDDWQSFGNPQLAKLDRAHGPRLLALPCEIMWATAWMDDANEVIAPLLGLPALTVADLPECPIEDNPFILHWKTVALIDIAAGRPFVWADDEITSLDEDYVAAHYRGKALLHKVNPSTGLTTADLGRIEQWLVTVAD